jgi:hypothetical protein
VRPRGIDADQRIQVGERIEQEMRLDLRLQQFEAGLRDLTLDRLGVPALPEIHYGEESRRCSDHK